MVRRLFYFFFFSSRRRHTRWNCDWSSDVCSSDLAVRRLHHDHQVEDAPGADQPDPGDLPHRHPAAGRTGRSEEHTSELQSQFHLVCRLLLEKKKKKKKHISQTKKSTNASSSSNAE